MNALELKIPPPLVALLIGIAMWLFTRSTLVELSFAVRTTVFIVIALAGGALALSGNREFKRARTTINPFKPENASSLVTSGVFRITRNPMYVGLVALLVGWTAFLGSLWALAGPIIFVLYITRFQIVPEERILAAKFGAAYDEYRSRVRRWL